MRYLFCCVFLLISLPGYASETVFDSAIIVLGTRPLDASTPSLDMKRRVERAVELSRAYPNALVIFSGGKTAGPISEARMMAQIAYGLGLSPQRVKLEESSRSTDENARYCVLIIKEHPAKKIFLITRPGHLHRAAKVFSQYACFNPLTPVASKISKDEILQDLRAYLKLHESTFLHQQINKIEAEPELVSGSR